MFPESFLHNYREIATVSLSSSDKIFFFRSQRLCLSAFYHGVGMGHDKNTRIKRPNSSVSATIPVVYNITTREPVHFIPAKIPEIAVLTFWALIDLALASRYNFLSWLPYFLMLTAEILQIQTALNISPCLTFFSEPTAQKKYWMRYYTCADVLHVPRG